MSHLFSCLLHPKLSFVKTRLAAPHCSKLQQNLHPCSGYLHCKLLKYKVNVNFSTFTKSLDPGSDSSKEAGAGSCLMSSSELPI